MGPVADDDASWSRQ